MHKGELNCKKVAYEPNRVHFLSVTYWFSFQIPTRKWQKCFRKVLSCHVIDWKLLRREKSCCHMLFLMYKRLRALHVMVPSKHPCYILARILWLLKSNTGEWRVLWCGILQLSHFSILLHIMAIFFEDAIMDILFNRMNKWPIWSFQLKSYQRKSSWMHAGLQCAPFPLSKPWELF